MSERKPPRDVLGFFVYFLSIHKWLVFLFGLTGIFYAIFSTSASYALKLLVDILADQSVNTDNVIHAIKIPVFTYIIILFCEITNYRITDIVKLKLIPAIRRDIHYFCFTHLSKQSYSYFQNSFVGNISSRLSELNTSVVSVVSKFDAIFAVTIKLLISSGFLFFVNFYFGALIIGWAVFMVGLSIFFSGRIVSLSVDFSSAKARLMGAVVDNFVNIVNVLSFANSRYENKVNKKVLDQTVRKDRKMQWKVIHMRFLQDFSYLIMFAALLFFCVKFYRQGIISAGDFVLVVNLTSSIAQNIWWISNEFAQLSEDIGKCRQAISIITAPIEVKDKPSSKEIVINKGLIKFDDVTFYYHKKRSLFEKKNIVIESGQKVGLVGFTGSGKSSFINLIMRFYEPKKGKILIDNQDIAKAKLESLRKQIAIIPQDTSLFHRTIMENIRYGDVHASDEEVFKAAEDAHCSSFISELTEGYNTYVGERGVKLSGGQRQRIAIARAFLKKASIIILDEATSALDSITERKIQKSLNKLTKGKTTIVIAHRLSTLADMDRILVFDKGKIVQDGSHLQLVRRDGGHYKKLWEMQADGFMPTEIDRNINLAQKDDIK